MVLSSVLDDTQPTSPPYTLKTLKLYYKTKPCEAKDIYVEEADWGQRIQYDNGANMKDKNEVRTW